jgi:ABC-type sugar transport system ATPase subunit
MADVVEESGRIVLATEEFSIPLHEADRLRNKVGETVTVGIRPEYLNLDENGHFEATIDLVEPQGSRDVLHLHVGDRTLRATTPQGQIAQGDKTSVQGEQRRFSIDTDQVWAFGDDGERLL